jgi:two-component system CheB/CheR fusion protein
MSFVQSDLVQVIQSLAQVRSLEEITQIVRGAARRLTGSDGATFVLKEEGFCHYVDEDAISPLWKGKKFPTSVCLSGWSMIHKKSLAIADIYQDPRVPIDAYRPTFVKSLVMVPIQQSSPIGAIGTYWATKHVASEAEIATLQALADTVAVAMENVNLVQSQSRQINELAEANRAKDQFLMMVSHELRTPLNAIEGWAELLSADGLSEEEVQQGLKTILRNAKAQNRIIEDLMDTSTIILNRIKYERKPIDLIAILENALSTIRFSASKKNLQVSFENQFENAWVLGDPERLHQVFTNILANAVKFTPELGHIHIRAEPAGPDIRIAIQDNGEGIPPSFLPHVFERFRQADDSLTRKHGGLGLGLAIARHIVQALNGDIQALSEGPGKGSTFTVSFPLYQSPLISPDLAQT